MFVIQEWRKIGIEAEHRPLETAAWFADGRDTGNFELIVAPTGRVHGRPRRSSSAATHREHPELGPLLRSRDRRPVLAAGRGRSTRPSARS